jgi:mercuric ion binding protein
MKFLKAIIFTLILSGFTQGLIGNVSAATTGEITTRFAIEKMNCPLCPITVRKSMEKVPGVKQVVVDYEMKIATVVFDPEQTSNRQIADASTDIGYPATVLAENTE